MAALDAYASGSADALSTRNRPSGTCPGAADHTYGKRLESFGARVGVGQKPPTRQQLHKVLS